VRRKHAYGYLPPRGNPLLDDQAHDVVLVGDLADARPEPVPGSYLADLRALDDTEALCLAISEQMLSGMSSSTLRSVDADKT
jgi:hypothetical protein